MKKIEQNAIIVLARIFIERDATDFFSLDDFDFLKTDDEKQNVLNYLRDLDFIEETTITKCNPYPIKISFEGIKYCESLLFFN